MGPVRLHILVLDDVVDAADSTAELLSLWGYNARACYDGTAALEYARGRRPDAVLVDLGMPGMDGFRFAGLFRGLPLCGPVPIIALSGYTGPVFAARARAAGINHYLVKPADPEQLRQLLGLEVAPPADRSPRDRIDSGKLVTGDTGRHCNAPECGGRARSTAAEPVALAGSSGR